MTKTIIIDGVAYAATAIQPTTVGVTEAKAPAPAPVATQKAVGTTPLWLVSYTSRAGDTKTYGVFWSGMKNGEHRLGLRPLVNGGHRMYQWNRRNSYSQGFFVAAADTKPLN